MSKISDKSNKFFFIYRVITDIFGAWLYTGILYFLLGHVVFVCCSLTVNEQ